MSSSSSSVWYQNRSEILRCLDQPDQLVNLIKRTLSMNPSLPDRHSKTNFLATFIHAHLPPGTSRTHPSPSLLSLDRLMMDHLLTLDDDTKHNEFSFLLLELAQILRNREENSKSLRDTVIFHGWRSILFSTLLLVAFNRLATTTNVELCGTGYDKFWMMNN